MYWVNRYTSFPLMKPDIWDHEIRVFNITGGWGIILYYSHWMIPLEYLPLNSGIFIHIYNNVI